jgi:hypothetical protein
MVPRLKGAIGLYSVGLAVALVLFPSQLAAEKCDAYLSDLPHKKRRFQYSMGTGTLLLTISAFAIKAGVDEYRSHALKAKREHQAKLNKELLEAIENTDLKKVRELISLGADVRQLNDEPLAKALGARHELIAKELIRAGAQFPKDGQLAVSLAQSWNHDLAVQMLKHNAGNLPLPRGGQILSEI